MTVLIIYAIGFLVTWFIATLMWARWFGSYETMGLIMASLLGMLVGLMWPITLIGFLFSVVIKRLEDK